MRVRVVLLGVTAAFCFLGTVLWRVQVLGASEYTDRLNRQSIRRVRLPGIRGRILDRNGVCLAENRPSYCVAIYVEELRQPKAWTNTVNKVEEVVDHLSRVLQLGRQITREHISTHVLRRRPLPLLAWKGIRADTLARWAECGVAFPGVDVYVEPVRYYPRGPLATHVIGYVGRLEWDRDPEDPYRTFYLPEMEGKYGMETNLNSVLAGSAGGMLIRVDALGFKHKHVGYRSAGVGHDVVLTLDAGIQRLAEEALSGEVGAVVVLNPRNGDVLAMASAPSFDPNTFYEDYTHLVKDSRKPLLNRAISGWYPPGSTFKPCVAVAALENRRATAHQPLECPGYFEVGGVRFRCWRKNGHGRLGMRKALEQSCNAYFCQLGLQAGYECIYHMAAALGFGRETGIELAAELPGLLPNNSWKVRKSGDEWRAGDTCNVSIGQGPLLVTPLQMAMFAATLANGGVVYRPRLTRRGGRLAEGELANSMGWSSETLEVVRGGMHDVVQSETGTGKRARVAGIEMGGKTGSAEYGPRSDRKKHAWMIAFAPFDNPEYAVALVIEDGISGGMTAAPRMRVLMEGIFHGGVERDERIGDGGQAG